MSTINPRSGMLRKTLIAATVASVLLAACAAAPVKPDGAAEARSKLTQLQSDPNLAGRAPVAMKEADAAVQAAERRRPIRRSGRIRSTWPNGKSRLREHRLRLASRKISVRRSAHSARTPVSLLARRKRMPRTSRRRARHSKLRSCSGRSTRCHERSQQARRLPQSISGPQCRHRGLHGQRRQ
jgi:hypothetical protein